MVSNALHKCRVESASFFIFRPVPSAWPGTLPETAPKSRLEISQNQNRLDQGGLNRFVWRLLFDELPKLSCEGCLFRRLPVDFFLAWWGRRPQHGSIPVPSAPQILCFGPTEFPTLLNAAKYVNPGLL
jgi:hypothetical protein